MRQQVAGPASRVRMKYCRASWSGWNEAREAIHPFTDGKGRTGRILNILFPVEQGLLDLTVLYLSHAIIRSKDRYYEGLRRVTAEGACADWVLYMLETFREMADATRWRILQIHDLMGSCPHDDVIDRFAKRVDLRVPFRHVMAICRWRRLNACVGRS